jgi:RNA polymerase sigma-70 factor (ECF subfamily)
MSPPAFDVPACLAAVRRGDADAARALVEHLYPLVIKIVRAHRPRRTGEEDLAQEVFMKLFTRLDQYHGRDGVPLEHWVSRVAVTTCLDALRSERRRPEWRWADLGEGERAWVEFFVGEEPASAPADVQSAREATDRLLSLLAPDDRLVLTLLDLEERSVAEISALTGWGRSAVKVRAFRARQKLRKHALQLRQESKL